MDTRDTIEQADLRGAARRLVDALGPKNVADLNDTARATKLAAAVRDAGWLELRQDVGGAPLAGGVETAIVAEALGAGVGDVAFTGPVLASDLARRAGAHDDSAVVAFDVSLTGVATTDAMYAGEHVAVDAAGAVRAYVLVPDGDRHTLGSVDLSVAVPQGRGSDLTRQVRVIAPGATDGPGPASSRSLTRDDLVSWTALGLALTSADLVGTMRGVLDITVAYATDRRQYGVPIGSFQAVQHLLAESRCLLEGSVSAAAYAAWAVDHLGPDDAVTAGRVAKAYCARAARTVHETAIQVHGGIGNTWECIVHVYLRRSLLSTQWFGDDGVQLHELQHTRLGGSRGLS